MEYKNIINLLDNAPYHPSKFRTKTWVEINDDSSGTYNTNNQIKFKVMMLSSSLCYYGGACILISGPIKTAGAVADHAAKLLDERNKGVKIEHHSLTV